VTQVVFELHPSFTVPIRALEQQPFELTESGWGEFEVNIKVQCSFRTRTGNEGRHSATVTCWWGRFVADPTPMAVRSCTLRTTPRSLCLS